MFVYIYTYLFVHLVKTYNINININFVSLHLSASNAAKLFSNALIYIGRASYQEEYRKSSGELVVVFMKQMEKVLSVAGWCLASGVVSKEQYGSIVEKIFSDQHSGPVNLVYCISDVAVTCVVEEDLTRTDELVFLKCHNLFEVIDIELSSASARFEVSSSWYKSSFFLTDMIPLLAVSSLYFFTFFYLFWTVCE